MRFTSFLSRGRITLPLLVILFQFEELRSLSEAVFTELLVVQLFGTMPETLKVNQELIDKHKFLAGIKSYKTNSKLPPSLVVERYGDLWKIEKSFRMTKHDLKARPIFHRKERAIQAHILIVFAANAVCRHIELQTHKPISQVVKELMRIIDVKFKMKNSNQIYSLTLPPH
jgi:transposase